MTTAITLCLGLASAFAPIDASECVSPIRQVLHEAEIPYILWDDYVALAGCESSMDASSIGDGGLARGLFQIHWDHWSTWAENQGLGTFNNWRDPVQNARLAYAIGKHYDQPRYGDMFHQWSAKPHWRSCQSWIGREECIGCSLKMKSIKK